MIGISNGFIFSDVVPFECITNDLLNGKIYRIYCGSDGVINSVEVVSGDAKKWIFTDTVTNDVFQLVTSNGEVTLGTYSGEAMSKDDLLPIISMLTEIKNCACASSSNVGFTMTYVGD